MRTRMRARVCTCILVMSKYSTSVSVHVAVYQRMYVGGYCVLAYVSVRVSRCVHEVGICVFVSIGFIRARKCICMCTANAYTSCMCRSMYLYACKYVRSTIVLMSVYGYASVRRCLYTYIYKSMCMRVLSSRHVHRCLGLYACVYVLARAHGTRLFMYVCMYAFVYVLRPPRTHVYLSLVCVFMCMYVSARLCVSP